MEAPAMKAALITAFGPPEVLEIVDVPEPPLKKGQVLVRVHAAAVNPKDTFIRKGRFKRFTGRRFPLPTGFDFSGEVVNIGEGAHATAVGDCVFGMLNGWRGGTCAEYVSVDARHLYAKPVGLSHTEAAAMPLVALTALQALRDKAGLQAGHHVCINGAAGGVGSMAVQIAKTMGAVVTTVSRASNHEFLMNLGADTCIDYRERDITAVYRRFDVFFDVFGNRPFDRVKHTLTERGIWVSTVIRAHVFMSMAKTWLSSRRKATMVVVKSDRDDLKQISDWVAAGAVRPIVHSAFPLEKIADAHRQQETAHTQGKIVIPMRPS
jgi:NADPH:quinone reductase-like Zn-dependent oxidoreductase